MFLKLGASVIAILFVIQSHAANYYFSASGNDSYTNTQAQNTSTPWKSLTKLNSYFSKLNPGDSILFKRGETFAGSITINKSGNAAKSIVLSAYGKGARPIITGLVPATNWVNLGGGIYQADCPLASTAVNIVTLNGVPQQIGRYPNATATNGGYLNIDNHAGKTQLTSSQLNTSVNWAGGTVVIRKNHWTVTTGTITSNTATVVNYTETSAYTATNNFGFFIQNHPKTLDQYGEWYINAAQKKIQMYMGTTVPNNNSVAVGGVDYIIKMAGYSYITIDGLTFTGANINNINIFSSNYFQIKNSTFTSSGSHSITSNLTTGFAVTNCSLTNSNNDGIQNNGGTGTQITNDTLKNTGVLAGMGLPNDGSSYEAIVAIGVNGTVNNCIIQNTGANGIDFGGNYTTVKNNYINNFELIKDDGGGIYTNMGGKDTVSVNVGMNITGNIVVNTVGAPAGTTGAFTGSAPGIYLDDNSSGVTVTGNTVASCNTGILIHNNRSVTVSGNTFYNNLTQVLFSHNNPIYAQKNNNFNNNIVFSTAKTQPTLAFISIANDIGRSGVFNNNYYSNTIDNTYPINANGNMLDLGLWQYTYAKDLTSFNAALIPCYTVSIPSKKSKFTNSSFVKNITNASAWSANGNFKASWDNSGMLDGGSLKTYFSYVSGSTGNNPTLLCTVGAVSASTVYSLDFSMISNMANRKLVIYIRNTNSPYNTISDTKYVTVSNKRTENTIMLTPTVSTSNATIVFAFQSEDFTTWFDNLYLYTTNAQANNPSQNIFFAYNATPKSATVKLASSYIDVKNKPYKGSTTLAPFSSIILIKNQDTLLTAPPVVYSIPQHNTDSTLYSVNATPKQAAATIAIYPNPTTDHFMLNFNDQSIKDLNIKLINTRGDVILSQKVQVVDSTYQLNFNNKPAPGCYFIQLSGIGINQTSKVIIM